jgi:hypothetical protein
MSEPLTLSALCGIEGEVSGVPVTKAERDKLVQAMKNLAAGPALSGFNIGERLLDFVGASLRKPVAEILEEVWSQRKELREVAAKGKDKRDVEAKVKLYPHTITYTVRPSVQVQVGGQNIGPKMTFDATAELKLDGLQLVIKNAWIIQVRAGTLTSTLNLKYEGMPLMAPCEKEIDIPIHLKLPKGGIRLGGDMTPPPLTPEKKKE